jgi:N-acetylneuraminic acid mutarotase
VADLPAIERYDFRLANWRVECFMNSRRAQFACVRLNEKLYLCGGRDSLKTYVELKDELGFGRATCRLNSVEIFDLLTKAWTVGVPMLSSRHDLAATSIGNPFYAIGGHDGRNYLNTVERYDPETSTWSSITSMLHARSQFGVTTFEQRYLFDASST